MISINCINDARIYLLEHQPFSSLTYGSSFAKLASCPALDTGPPYMGRCATANVESAGRVSFLTILFLWAGGREDAALRVSEMSGSSPGPTHTNPSS